MPDTPPESGAEEPGAAGTPQPDDATKSLDVPEWVSEIRRLYVEPKTRAKLRQEGAIAPQKRKLGLPGLRGSRRSGDGNGGDRAGGAHSARSHSRAAEPTDVSRPAPTTPMSRSSPRPPRCHPARSRPLQPDPVYDGRRRGGGPTRRRWSRSRSSRSRWAPGSTPTSWPPVTRRMTAMPKRPAEDAIERRLCRRRGQLPAPSPTPPTQPVLRSRTPRTVVAPQADAALVGRRCRCRPPDPEPLEEEHHRSLAELAGLSPPEPGPDTWLPAVPPAAAVEPPVDTVVTSIPEPAGEPEAPPVSAPVAQPEALVEPGAVEPAVVEPAAEHDEPDPARSLSRRRLRRQSSRQSSPSQNPACPRSPSSPMPPVHERSRTGPQAEPPRRPPAAGCGRGADHRRCDRGAHPGARSSGPTPVAAIEETTPVAAVESRPRRLRGSAVRRRSTLLARRLRQRSPTLARAAEHRAGRHPVVA